MDPVWRTQLEGAGAVIADNRVLHFGNPALEADWVSVRDVIADLSDQALIRVTGSDAERFLQGQLTCDVREVDADRSRLGAYCNPQGRVLACFRLLRHENGYYLTLPETLLAKSLTHLRKYVLLSKVQMTIPLDLIQVGCSGPRMEALLSQYGKDTPAETDGTLTREAVTVVRLPGPYPRYSLIGGRAVLSELWSALRPHAAPIGAPAWELLDISAGLPAVFPETEGTFLPQWLNLDLLGGVSFKKGCYTGQEVVARTHYLGKLKRRMYRLHCSDDLSVRPGQPLYSPVLRPDEAAGTVVRAQVRSESGLNLLAVLHRDSVRDALHLIRPDGPVGIRQALPYDVDAAD